MRAGMSRLGLPFLAAAILAAAISGADAETVCDRLQSQYVSLDSQTFQDSFQLDQVRATYDNVRNQARAAGCTGLFSIFSKRSRECPAIMARLAQVQRQYAQIGGGTGLFGF